jgi:hypothetical protein
MRSKGLNGLPCLLTIWINQFMKSMLAMGLVFFSALTMGDELSGAIEIHAAKLKQIHSFERAKRFSDRQKSFVSAYIDLALVVDPMHSVNDFVLMANDQQKIIKVAESGELLIPSIGEVLSDPNAALMLPKDKYKDGVDVNFRIKIKLPLHEQIEKKILVNVVNQYEQATKSMWGWASFAVPHLDCLALVYDKRHMNKEVAMLDENLPSQKLIRTNHNSMMFVDFSKPVESLKILQPPMWIFGCKYSRWQADWE